MSAREVRIREPRSPLTPRWRTALAWTAGVACVALLAWWQAVVGLIAGLLLLRVAFDRLAEARRVREHRAR